jgi:hypothetical protein
VIELAVVETFVESVKEGKRKSRRKLRSLLYIFGI